MALARLHWRHTLLAEMLYLLNVYKVRRAQPGGGAQRTEVEGKLMREGSDERGGARQQRGLRLYVPFALEC